MGFLCPGMCTVARGIDLNISSTILNGSTNDATHDRAVGKVDGKSVIPTDTKLNVTVSVENTPEGTLLQNEVQVKVDV